jgi:hypothetical protein
VGLTTALVVLRTGWVIVGSLPTKDGTIGTVGAGCLIVLDANGNPVETFSGGVINGPWDMTARDGGFISQLFFTNVLNGGVGLASNDDERDGDTLYVADSVNNRIARIEGASFRFSSAGTGQTVSTGGSLNTPLGLTLAPNGDILIVNGGDGNIVETTPGGTQTASATIAPAGGGALFGLAVIPGGSGIYFVDDSENQLNLFH